MNSNRLKALALAAPLCLSLALASPQALAADLSTPETTVLTLSPRYEHLSLIAASLTISNLGRAACGGTCYIYDMYEDCDSRMTMLLQRYESTGWEDVKDWSQDFTGSGNKMMDKGYYVSSGYRYRMTVTVEILDSDGNVIESVSCDSPIKEY